MTQNESTIAHARQLDAVNWVSAAQLGKRWSVSARTVREIPRGDLPYLTLGGSHVRRYDPRDVEAYEEREKRGNAA
jgi:hypothetical protein